MPNLLDIVLHEGLHWSVVGCTHSKPLRYDLARPNKCKHNVEENKIASVITEHTGPVDDCRLHAFGEPAYRPLRS